MVRATFGRLYNILNEAGSNWDPDNKDDSKVWADLELLWEKADQLAKLEEEVMDLLLQEEVREEELNNEMQSADEYASKYKIISFYVRKRVSAAAKRRETVIPFCMSTRGNSSCPLLNSRSLGAMLKIG